VYIRRDYSKSFFRDRKPKRHIVRNLLILLALIGAIGGYFYNATEGQVIKQPEMAVTVALSFIAPEMTPTPQPSYLASQAQNMFWAGALDDAVETMAQVVAMRPDSVDYLYEYGMLLLDLNGDAEDVEQTALDIIAIDPNDPRGYSLRARALVWQGNPSGAIPVALAGIDIDPDFAPLYQALARAYIGEGQLREGQEMGLRAVELAPGDVRSHWAYATSLAQSGARDEAILEYEATVQVNPNFLPPYFELAFLYLASNRDQEAIDTYDRILGVQPRSARALLRQCEAYRKIGQFQRAMGLCQDAVTSDPDFLPAQYRYGLLLYNEFDFAGAQQAFQRCVDLDASNLECTYRLGLTYYYLARDSYRVNCEGNRALSGCESVAVCQQGWQLLQDSLVMAQARENVDADIDIIREGLGAISGDPACAGISGRRFPTMTPPPSTDEAPATAPTIVPTPTPLQF
jgi:tetratricopeptide (TPR) repeat protein